MCHYLCLPYIYVTLSSIIAYICRTFRYHMLDNFQEYQLTLSRELCGLLNEAAAIISVKLDCKTASLVAWASLYFYHEDVQMGSLAQVT